MLIIFGGLPGSGKTTLAKAITKRLSATYIRIDSIEQAIKSSMLKIEEVYDAGYLVGYNLACENLKLGQIVIADSVNAIEITRKAWQEVAKQAKSNFVEVEIVCSNQSEHKRRIETRKADILGLKLPDWEKARNRDYENWKEKHIRVDTAGRTIEESVNELLDKLQDFLRKASA